MAFHLRHITRSADRLLTYAEGGQLSPDQIAAMKTELDPGATRNELLAELVVGFSKSVRRIRAFSVPRLQEERYVGKKQLPSSVGGLLVHIADHTQRHVGQAITTAKIIRAQRHQSDADESLPLLKYFFIQRSRFYETGAGPLINLLHLNR